MTNQSEKRYYNDQSKWRDISRRTNQSIEQIDVTGLKRGKTRVTKSWLVVSDRLRWCSHGSAAYINNIVTANSNGIHAGEIVEERLNLSENLLNQNYSKRMGYNNFFMG